MSPEESPATTGASTPPASPVAAVPPEAPKLNEGREESLDAGEESSVDWNAMDQLDGGDTDADGGAGPAPTTPVVKAAPKAPAAPVAAPTPAAPVQPPAQPPVAAAPAALPAAVQPPPAVAPIAQPPAAAPAPAVLPAAPVAPAETPEQKVAREQAERTATEKQEKEALDALVKEYNLPEDAVAKLSTEPEQVLPWLAAKVHQNVQTSVVNAVTRLLSERLPAMIQQSQTLMTTEAKSRETFYGRWPQLKDHEATIIKAGKMFRELNPNASPQVALEAVGKLVCDSLGIPVTAVGAPPAVPAASAFRPAGAGSAPGGAPPASDNVFTSMAEELLADGD